MTRPKNQLENEYIATKSDIKAHITMIKAYTEGIQKSRHKLDNLSQKLTELQQEYINAGYDQGEKDEFTESTATDTAPPSK